MGALAALAGIFFVVLGAIFLIAWSLENALAGALMVAIGGGLIYYTYRMEKIEAAKPKLMSQTFNVRLSDSGEMTQKDMMCRSCGAPMSEKDVRVVQGGLMAKCSYCGVVFALQEAPKW